MASKRDLLSITDFTPEETRRVISWASQAKAADPGKPLSGKSVALLFEKPSLRTRVSFEVGVQQLGDTPFTWASKRSDWGSASRSKISPRSFPATWTAS